MEFASGRPSGVKFKKLLLKYHLEIRCTDKIQIQQVSVTSLIIKMGKKQVENCTPAALKPHLL